ncbi:MAG: hypothetical protein ACE5F6_20235 [Anaerolineae bacterium]
MDTVEQPYRSHLFTVRMWQEAMGAGQSEWRGRVQHVLSGETRYFRDWPALLTHVQAMLEDAELDGHAEEKEAEDEDSTML